MALIRIGERKFLAGQWAVQNSIGGLTLLWGKSGSYKSFLAIHTAVCVAAGHPWFGKRTTQGAVVYIVGEGGLDQFGYRCEMAAKTMGLKMANLPIYAHVPAVNLVDPKMGYLLAEEWASVKPTLVIIDTLSRCFSGDENKQEDMQRFVNNLDKIKEKLNCTVMPVHHANKEGEIRGSTVLFAAADVSIKTNRVKKNNIHILNLESDKMKDLDYEDFYPKELIATPVDVRNGSDAILIDDMGAKVSTLVLSEKPEIAVYEQEALGCLLVLAANRAEDTAVGYKEWLEASKLTSTSFRRGVEGLMARKAVEMPRPGQYFEAGKALEYFDPGENYNTTPEELKRQERNDILDELEQQENW